MNIGKFDLTSTLEPTDEQLQAIMDAVGERGRRSTQNKHEMHARMLREARENIRNARNK